MRQRRINAKLRVTAQAFIAGEFGAAETCHFFCPFVYQNQELWSEKEATFIKAVCSETDTLPVGRLKDDWHPDFVGPKLEQLHRFEAAIASDVRKLCEALLDKFKKQDVEAENQ